MLSVLELFNIGIGPSSSHTVGPMRAARAFAERIRDMDAQAHRVHVELFGSLGATGRGHGTPAAIVLGLLGEAPETVDLDTMHLRVEACVRDKTLVLVGGRQVAFDMARDLGLHRKRMPNMHANAMRFTAFDGSGHVLLSQDYASVGGGFVHVAGEEGDTATALVPFPYKTGSELLSMCRQEGISMSTLVLRNECAQRSETTVRAELLRRHVVMQACIDRGCATEGVLPGGLKVRRRAPQLLRRLQVQPKGDLLAGIDWLNLWALAVSEENAAGGRVVTAPTNGAAGILPSVMRYMIRFHRDDDDAVVRFMLTAGGIGLLYKMNASISGAEVGCQGEVGVACSMAAAGIAEVLGGTPEQVEDAAEIAMEHNLGLTCDPVGGLVQVPCIERNAMGAVKAINAARLALAGSGDGRVSLDRVIATMRQTGADMKTKYKETARGGLAVNVIEC